MAKEKEIDDFVDCSHSLLNYSGADRIKPLISQISNRCGTSFKIEYFYLAVQQLTSCDLRCHFQCVQSIIILLEFGGGKVLVCCFQTLN